ncbi:2OG-Fe(II) oxygenase [Gluconacetobacter azotocaptans]|uniref:2OG-Fe(II) oxygenase n=1 Tax=Gluconacetobacter azotocaptans TaxID=142834 RepID=A0A7W4JUD5_9PROT|nr:2OG-Fe(II) oxygenase [Gluconacetobacter azotocaptans]MBB2191088.1 2OG-Fe(II) oxygenase [Gluconacetobacter azotocaptans]GBQ26262.1 hypothetical protein AA13594_0186 [Gluconacetobacter azotocaptans DSM 13594]
MTVPAPIRPNYAALEAAAVSTDPFAHVVVPHFVGPDDLAALVASMPDLSSGGSFPPGSLTLAPLVRGLVAEMEGPRLRGAIARKFGLDLDGAPTMLTLRGRTREKDGRIHCDSVTKRVTVLLYLNPSSESWARQEGCLRLLRGPDDVEDYAAEIPPIDGTLLIFPNGPTTWHGHRQYVGRRYTIQLNYMENDAKARSEMRRHRLSALAKRLSHAA